MKTASNKTSKHKKPKRPLNSVENGVNDLSNLLCGACQLPLHKTVSQEDPNAGLVAAVKENTICPTQTTRTLSNAHKSQSSQIPRQVSDDSASLTSNTTPTPVTTTTNNITTASHNNATSNTASASQSHDANGGTTMLLQPANSNSNPPRPPIMNHNNSTKRHYHLDTIITCSNMFVEVKCCNAPQTPHASPHYHFSCLEKIIHPKSKHYNNICQYIQEREEDSKRKEEDLKRKRLKKQHAGNLKKGGIVYHPGIMPDKIPWPAGQKHHNANLTGSTSSSIGSYSINESLDSNTSSGRNTPTYRKTLMKNPFICNVCDMQGSTQYLGEYFYNFRSVKCGFYQDEEAVDPINPVAFSNSNPVLDGSGTCKIDHYHDHDSGMVRENGFVKYLMSKEEGFDVGMPHTPTEVSIDRIRAILQYTHDRASYDCNIDANHSDDAIKNKNQTAQSFDFSTLNGFHLIGQPIRLFCAISNSYHTGRIIDARQIDEMESSRLKKHSRQKYIRKNNNINSNEKKKNAKSLANPITNSATDSPDDMLLDKEIGRTQYLVRFRASCEGRKVALQQWLYLEEHPIMVGVNIVWAKVHIQDENESTSLPPVETKGTRTVCSLKNDLSVDVEVAKTTLERRRRLKQANSKFRPAQIFLRTALEMMHVDDINVVSEPGSETSIVNASHCSSDVANNGDTHMLALNGASKPSMQSLNAVALLFGKQYQCIRIDLTDKKRKSAPAIAVKPSATVHCASASSVNTDKECTEKKSIGETEDGKNIKSGTEKRMEYEISILEKTFDDISAVDFHHPPADFKEHLQVLRGYDDSLVNATTCALLEEEEQKRVLIGHNA